MTKTRLKQIVLEELKALSEQTEETIYTGPLGNVKGGFQLGDPEGTPEPEALGAAASLSGKYTPTPDVGLTGGATLSQDKGLQGRLGANIGRTNITATGGTQTPPEFRVRHDITPETKVSAEVSDKPRLDVTHRGERTDVDVDLSPSEVGATVLRRPETPGGTTYGGTFQYGQRGPQGSLNISNKNLSANLGYGQQGLSAQGSWTSPNLDVTAGYNQGEGFTGQAGYTPAWAGGTKFGAKGAYNPNTGAGQGMLTANVPWSALTREHIKRSRLDQIILEEFDLLLQEHAKDYIWGVKAPYHRTANQYQISVLNHDILKEKGKYNDMACG